MDSSTLAFLLVLALAYSNGTNDVSKAIATLVGSGVTNYRAAIAWGTVWTIIGALASGLVATAMVKTFSTGLIQADIVIPSTAAVSVIVGAMAWVLVASWTGLPVSTTHALTGSIVGAGMAAIGAGGLIWPAIVRKIALPLLLSPLLAVIVTLALHPLIRSVVGRWQGVCLCIMPAQRALVTIGADGATRTLFQASAFGQPLTAVPAQCDRAGLSGWSIGPDTIHWVSSGLASLARGTNDAPKILAMLVLGSVGATWSTQAFHNAALIGVAIAMGLGSFLGGLRVTEVLAEKVTRMDHTEGLSANLTTSSLVLVSATLGLPVSTTHVSTCAIIGTGLLKGLNAVQWMTVRDMVLAWIVTLPAAGVLAHVVYLLLNRSSRTQCRPFDVHLLGAQYK